MLRQTLLAISALLASSLASGQSLEPLAGIARLSYVEGEVRFQAAQDAAPAGLPERPLVAGDRLITDKGGRAELGLGSGTLRASERTKISLVELAAKAARVELAAGSASLHLRDLLEGETFAIETPAATIDFLATGEYRVDVFGNGATEIAVRNGLAEIATAGGPVRVSDGQRVRIESRNAHANLMTPQAADDFDEWVLEREVQLANAEPREAPDEYYDETLDRYGEWRDDPSYGRVWMPAYAYGGYDPFRNGYWQRTGYGYSWYDPMPWGAYTYDYGRWAYLNDRWCWVPRQRRRHDNPDPGPVAGEPIRVGSGAELFRRTADAFRRHEQATAPVQGSSGGITTAPVSQGADSGQQSAPQRTPSAPTRNPTASQGSGNTPAVRPSRPAESRSRSTMSSRPAATPKGSPPTQPQ